MAPPSTSVVKRGPLKSILAGGLAGGIEITASYPTEYVKTQLQLMKPGQFRGPVHCVQQTIKNHGFLGMYRGLGMLVAGSIPKAAFRFLFYEQARNMLMKDGELSRPRSFCAGLIAGVGEAIFAVCPMETVKVMMIADQRREIPQYRGLVHGIRSMVSEQGFRGIYRGLAATIVKQGSNQAIRFLLFNEYRKFITGDTSSKLPVHHSLLGGAVAGMSSCVVNTPVDVIKTKMQSMESSMYNSTIDCIQQTFRNQGARGFYRGLVPRLSRVCLDSALIFTLYDQVITLIDRAW
eukprot:TRINITY_DN36181_c0_g1_i1.p1 TRINITY_DN36181_c0_g1~~TRINITY_DN36181_c0_g1_i1.p1  ORF type:complete len:292 (+),score=33.47 TRINITY_DN36181_c0_g1_i1:98-973(+)